MEVRQGWGYKYVATGNLTQSGGVVADVWKPVIKKYGQKNKSWLILGLATGTVAKLIPQPSQITGVEIDPLMLNIGKKYFDLDQIPNLKILRLSAERYVLRADEVFDFVLVDLYLGDQVPSFVYSKNFLDQLGQLGQLVIINHLFYDDSKRQKAEELLKKLKAIFKKIELVRVLTNLVIIAKHV
ncbi:MAG: Spermine synthase [Candidatus Woesebacteria bacterium GW2011_GWA1_41_13b]|uniref:Spermine synthase n=1 Tax=Candidatus Woesebacteria bacterium GW2011_GWA1_41_13b TaxID=1618555 RepID=A0A0G0XTS8_9BACT|nr:MAG: Spermine synthase [Candidatus Woesebacteria bacterium GW2011_GWA1_41_13b]